MSSSSIGTWAARVAEGLRACGWTVHRIGDVFPDDGQDVPDEEWITHGLDRS
ncbi:hypothetical protein [Streptomyces sp. NBC_00280]|uniref:PIN-like domain-containing protein n=1 Tax=Streptomyces sp. NBC_00280 TaxID=2975699 RepID=UPI003253E06D